MCGIMYGTQHIKSASLLFFSLLNTMMATRFSHVDLLDTLPFHIHGEFDPKKRRWHVNAFIEWTPEERAGVSIARYQHMLNISLFVNSPKSVYLDIFSNTGGIKGLGKRALKLVVEYLVRMHLVDPAAKISLDAVAFNCDNRPYHRPKLTLEEMIQNMVSIVKFYEPSRSTPHVLKGLDKALVDRYGESDLNDLEFVTEIYCSLLNQHRLIQYYVGLGLHPVNGILNPLGETNMEGSIEKILR